MAVFHIEDLSPDSHSQFSPNLVDFWISVPPALQQTSIFIFCFNKNGCLGTIFYEYCGEFFFLSMQARGSCASFVNQKFSVWQEKSLPNSGLHMTFNINFGPSTSRNFYNMKISHCIQVFFMRITRGPLSKLQ